MRINVLKTVCLLLVMVCLLASCKKVTDIPEVNVETAGYVLKYELWNHERQYIFVLTPQNTVLAQYKDSESNYEELEIELTEYQIKTMKPYVDEILTLSAEDIEGQVNFTDYWYVRLYFNNREVVVYDYTASKNASVNSLLEEIIYCCDFKNNR